MTLLDIVRPVRRRADRQNLEAFADQLCWTWRAAAIGAGIARTVLTPSGPTDSTPTIVDITVGPPTAFTVQLLPGQVVDDVRRVARRLAEALGAVMLRVSPAGFGHVRVELLDRDPLAEILHLGDHQECAPGHTPGDPLLWIGRTEDGTDVTCRPDELPHMICQGRTRSGKSAWAYALLAQLAPRPDVLVAGVDASGLLLRPFTRTEHARRQVVGLRDLVRVEQVLAELVEEMDARIAAIPPMLDRFEMSFLHPLVLVVLEEWPAVLRTLDADPNDKGRGKRVRALVGRLLAESHNPA